MEINGISTREQQKEIAQRIEEFIDFEILDTPANFARTVGIDPSGLYKMLNGKMKITIATLKKISATYRVNMVWLTSGIGEVFESEEAKEMAKKLSIENEGEDEKAQISLNPDKGRPYFDVDFLGGFSAVLNDQTITPNYNIDFLPYNHEGVMWCNITGRSMEPKISNGDIIALKEVINWQEFLAFGEIYAIVAANGLRTIKIIRKGTSNENLKLVPINTAEYDEQEIPKSLILRIFSVLGCMKRL